jgi:phosphoribosylpyrophosphate synthetase
VSLRVVIFDLGGTVVVENNPKARSDARKLFYSCRQQKLHIAIIVARTKQPKSAVIEELKSNDIIPDLLVTYEDVNAPKGSGLYVKTVLDHFEISPFEAIYLGNNDLHDYLESIISKVWYWHTCWSGTPSECPYQFQHPPEAINYIYRYFVKKNLWYWKLQAFDDSNLPVKIYSMSKFQRDHWSSVEKDAKAIDLSEELFKSAKLKCHDPTFIRNHFIASLYFEGLLHEADIITSWPSSNPEQTESIMGKELEDVALMFNMLHFDKLFIRHSKSIKSSTSRTNRETVSLANQINTVSIQQRLLGKIQEKTVIVVDDFTTEGHSLEWARHLLLSAGVKNVIGATWGKTERHSHETMTHTVYSLGSKVMYPSVVNSYSHKKPNVTEEDFICKRTHGIFNGDTTGELYDSYNMDLRENSDYECIFPF